MADGHEYVWNIIIEFLLLKVKTYLFLGGGSVRVFAAELSNLLTCLLPCMANTYVSISTTHHVDHPPIEGRGLS